MKVESNEVAQQVFNAPDGTQFHDSVGSDSVAYFIAHSRDPHRFSLSIFGIPVTMGTSLAGIQHAVQRTLHFKLQIDKEHVFLSDAYETPHPTGPVMSPDDFLASLPQKERDAIEAKVQRILNPPPDSEQATQQK
jgi:hypothetical protein